MSAIRLLLDCDPGLDDAIALALAMASPELEVTGLSTVAANAPIDTVTANAEKVMGRLACRFPLFQGAAKPLAITVRHSTDVWGGDGILPLAAPQRPAHRMAREEFIRRAVDADVVCAIGSLTNIAELIKNGHRPRRLAIMGGALGRGNATPHAELNIWADPQAAEIVFASGIDITLIPLDITRTLIVPADMTRHLAQSAAAPARLCGELLPYAGSNAHPAAIHDAAVIAALLWPDLFARRRGTLTVTTSGGEDGRTHFAGDAEGPHEVLTEVARDALFAHMQRRLCGEM
ncbi:nucleoside hydrolase [Taklimakanibacter lacteus]|uniref:nucleoside hydrolase n=1 Tax=Taklimakanibacter lacteus TaxID=2268456 RepID=UPI000E65FFCA